MDTSSVLQALRRESLDIYNRLHSIADDAAFVVHVHTFYPNIPLVPNLRCGAWYTDPAIASSIPAYFKSTDGHNNNWSFNLRRPNLHLLPFIVEHNSIVLVDSTRAGKRIPDALSKTVPIWCAVVNRAIIRRHPGPDKASWDNALYTPPGAVSAQEHHQIELRIDAWAEALQRSSFELPALPAPLRPFWITPATTTFPTLSTSSNASFLPVICLSASRQSDDARRPHGFAYVQGSGDDHELWSMGLTPAHYWRHTSTLLSASRSELPELVKTLILSDSARELPVSIDEGSLTKIAKVQGRLQIGTYRDVERAGWAKDLVYVLLPATSEVPMPKPGPKFMTIPLAPRIKTHLNQTILSRAVPFIGSELAHGRTVCIVCGGEKPGKEGDVGDEGVAVLLAALVVFFSDEGVYIGEDTAGALENNEHTSDKETDDTDSWSSSASKHMKIPMGIDKMSIRTRLEWVIACRPAINPARVTLKRLNEFLLSGEHVRRCYIVT
ncbi:tRNA A64-2'-O-ribosylphosphate transferase [Termitomyces sp. T112]|nr:tRNA A64-2'-O-ribosylphosphate transferase [Termitomyces sp. T112]